MHASSSLTALFRTFLPSDGWQNMANNYTVMQVAYFRPVVGGEDVFYVTETGFGGGK